MMVLVVAAALFLAIGVFTRDLGSGQRAGEATPAESLDEHFDGPAAFDWTSTTDEFPVSRSVEIAPFTFGDGPSDPDG